MVILALAIDPSTPTTLFAGTNSSGVYVSLDGGDHWSAASTGFPINDIIKANRTPSTRLIVSDPISSP
jgi:hypothetical protein